VWYNTDELSPQTSSMDDVEKIKQKVDVVDLLSGYMILKRAGKNFKGLCPFHSEKTPSFVVSPDRQIWHCFGCQKGGDIFSFLMEYEKIEFYESLKELAQKANITLSGGLHRNENEKKREEIFSVNAIASQFYHYLLTEHKVGIQALQYLLETRKIPKGLIDKFNLGFAPFNNSSLSTYLIKKKKYQPSLLVEAGLATQDRGGLRDFFRGRIIFPIHDARGNVIAFSGRAIDTTSSGPKYINTRETPVYVKGETVYGLYYARDEIKKQGKALIVEGEFDVISAVKEGIKNVVALKGTALTETQIKLLKRYADKFLFCFDTDIAGNSAQQRSIEMIEKEGIAAGVIVPPEGKDPDELLRENPSEFKKALKNEKNIYDFLIESIVAEFDSTNADGKRKIVDKTLPLLSGIENEVVKEHYFKKLGNIIDASLDSLLRQAAKLQSKQTGVAQASPNKKTLTREEMVESYLLSLLLQSGSIPTMVNATEVLLEGTSLSTPVYQKIYKALKDESLKNPRMSLQEFSKSLPPELHPSFDKCCLAPIQEFESDEQYADEVKKVALDVKSLSIKAKLKDLSSEIKTLEKENGEENEEKLLKLRGSFNALSQKIK